MKDIEISGTCFEIFVKRREATLDEIRYAAHALSDAAFVLLKKAGKGAVSIRLTPKHKQFDNTEKNLKKRFAEELRQEQLRSRITAQNQKLREFMLLKALSGTNEEIKPESALTPEQEKELDALIAQVEDEIKQETAVGKNKDPLGITRTWEDKYGPKNKTRKK